MKLKILIIIFTLSISIYTCFLIKSMIVFSVVFFSILAFLIHFGSKYISHDGIINSINNASQYEYQSTNVYDNGYSIFVRTANHNRGTDLSFFYFLVALIPTAIITFIPYIYYQEVYLHYNPDHHIRSLYHNKYLPHWLYGECALSLFVGFFAHTHGFLSYLNS